MKKTLLISAISVAMACMPIFQASAQGQSQTWQEMTKIFNDLKTGAEKNPKTMNALGVGAVGGGLVGAAKLWLKKPMWVRTGKGALMGSVVSAGTYHLAVPTYTDLKAKNNYRGAVDEVCYEAGLVAAAIVAFITT